MLKSARTFKTSTTNARAEISPNPQRDETRQTWKVESGYELNKPQLSCIFDSPAEAAVTPAGRTASPD